VNDPQAATARARVIIVTLIQAAWKVASAPA